MTEARLRVVPAGGERDAYLPLFYLADDSVQQVLSYYQTGTLFALDRLDGTPIGIVLAVDDPNDVVELKAVAVDEAVQGQGLGTRMLRAVLEQLGGRGVKSVVVGTSNSGIGQLAYYQKAGFRLAWIERDFFNAGRGYAEDLRENGILMRDMVWMDLEFVPRSEPARLEEHRPG